MKDSFRLGSDGIYRCDAFQEFAWQDHGFGTRQGNPVASVMPRQTHSDCVWNASGLKDREREGDALITDEVGKSIGIRTADCVPILLVDWRNRALAAVHAGWRGTAAGIIGRTIERMGRDFSTDPSDINAAVGPCIRECCYEIGAAVAEQFAPLFPEWEPSTSPRKLNLPEANRRQMKAAGVKADHVFDCDLCTSCESAQFFSFRREPENPGRMVASIRRLA